MKTKKLFSLLVVSLLLTTLIILSAVPTIVNAANSNYVSNRSPLVTTPFVRLPLGTVKATGWLLKQLELQRDGLTGHAEEIYPELDSNNAWLGGTGDNWERATYYVRGLIALAYTLNDSGLKTKAQKWMDWTLDHQQANGNIGPTSLDANDWWPRMPMLCALADYYDATGDSRVVTVLTNYFQYQNTYTPSDLGYWGKARAADNLDIVLWLYNRTGNSSLLTLADKLKNLSVDWSACFNNNNLTDTHAVNVAEGYKFPAVWYQKSLSSNDRNAYANGHTNIMNAHGQPHQLPSGTEVLAGRGSLQGYEQCCAAERLWSDGISQMIFGDAAIGDNMEKVAFNTMPASVSKTSRQRQYYILPNQAQSKYGNKGIFSNVDHYDDLLPGWNSGYICCSCNWHMGWPKFTMYSWAATDDNGLAIMAYSPTEVNAKVANGVSVKFVEDTKYPFEEQIRLTFTSSQSVQFPLKLRIPNWCASPSVKVNGVTQSGVTAGTFFTVNRTWNNNDTVTIDFPMTIKAVTQINDSVSIERGPLVYSLKIGENWTVYSQKTVAGLDFSQYEVSPTTAWNYALVVDKNNPGANMTVNTGTMPTNPFEQATTPITITARARQLPSWTMASNQLPAEVPVSPVDTTAAEGNITLIPFGAENIRITYFPVYGIPTAKSFTDNFDDGNANGWTTYDGTWSGASGQYTVGAFAGAKSVADGTSFSDLIYEADLSTGSSGDAGVIFRVTNPSTGWDTYNGYYAGINAGTDQIVLGKANGAWTQLSSASVTINPDTMYHMKIVATGANLKVYLTDMATPKININDNSWASGAIGLRTFNSSAKWDNVAVSVPGGSLCFEAEKNVVNHADVRSSSTASNGWYVGGIDYSDSYVQFNNVTVPTAGTYAMVIRYANGMGSVSTHNLYVNGGGAQTVSYPATPGWAQFSTVTFNVGLNAGANTLKFMKGATQYAELDCITIPQTPNFTDDFNDGNDNSWTKYGGTWSISSGWYTVASDPGTKSVANGTNYTNFTYEADIQISTSGSNNNAGLIFRVTNPSTGADAYNGYYLGMQNNRIMLGRASGSWTELRSYSMTITLNTTYHVKVVANSSNIKVYVSDMSSPKIDCSDSTWTSGAIGVRTYTCGAKFDNVSVQAQ